MFDGLTSRCTSPTRCAAPSAAAICSTIDTARGRQRAVGEQFGDGLTVDQPHGHVQAVVDLAEIVDRHDVRLVEPGGRLGLATEPRLILRVVGEVRGQHL